LGRCLTDCVFPWSGLIPNPESLIPNPQSLPSWYTAIMNLLIWGGGGHALTVIETAQAEGRFTLFAVMADKQYAAPVNPVLAVHYADAPAELSGLIEAGYRVAIAAIGDCQARVHTAARLRAAGLEMATLIHPTAFVSPSAVIGSGTLVGPNAVVGACAVIGNDVIINSGAIVEHECVISDGCHICPGVRLAGNVSVGAAAWVGIGAVVIQKLSIGAGALIGAGAVVTRDIDAGVVAYGVPARGQGLGIRD
jgi:UDP-N-acetylbacillosamine N-acetyltransferase